MKSSVLKLPLAFLMLLALSSAEAAVFCRHAVRTPLTEIRYLINTEDLLSYTEKGNPSRAGIPSYMSSRAFLGEVLSLRGPLGPLGAPGEFGPIGDNVWNPSTFWLPFLRAGNQSARSIKMMKKNGPLSSEGSLGDKGPLAKDWGEGAYSILGTTGILGPLGPLGALGLMGALKTIGISGPDEAGNYYQGNKIVKTINIGWGDSVREFELVEKYTSQEADRRSKNGSLGNSYMVDASMSPTESSRSYTSVSPREKVISVLVIPDLGLMAGAWGFLIPTNFDIEVRDVQGRLIGKSTQSLSANFVQFAVPKNEPYQVIVKRQGFSWASLGYRLISVGAGAEFFETFPDVLEANWTVDWKSQFQSYLERVKERSR